jgi:predicted glycosyltransferase
MSENEFLFEKIKAKNQLLIHDQFYYTSDWNHHYENAKAYIAFPATNTASEILLRRNCIVPTIIIPKSHSQNENGQLRCDIMNHSTTHIPK